MSFRSLGLVVIGALALPSWAHHSHGNYSPDFMDLEGIVVEVTLINPHSWIFLEVTDENGSGERMGSGIHEPRWAREIGCHQ